MKLLEKNLEEIKMLLELIKNPPKTIKYGEKNLTQKEEDV